VLQVAENTTIISEKYGERLGTHYPAGNCGILIVSQTRLVQNLPALG